MKSMNCPCGEHIAAMTDEALVAKVNDHLEKVHPEMAGKYSEEQILSVATES